MHHHKMEIVMKLSINNRAKEFVWPPTHRRAFERVLANSIFSEEHGVCKVFVPALQQYADTNISDEVTRMHAVRCGAVSVSSLNCTEKSNLNPILINIM